MHTGLADIAQQFPPERGLPGEFLRQGRERSLVETERPQAVAGEANIDAALVLI
jgi:hypothetical protein